MVNSTASHDDVAKGFLLAFKNREPDWALLDLDAVSELPAIKWKQINLAKMPDDKHKLVEKKSKRSTECLIYST